METNDMVEINRQLAEDFDRAARAAQWLVTDEARAEVASRAGMHLIQPEDEQSEFGRKIVPIVLAGSAVVGPALPAAAQNIVLDGGFSSGEKTYSAPQTPRAEHHKLPETTKTVHPDFGEGLSEIAEEYGTTLKVEKQLNPDLKRGDHNFNLLYPSDDVRVPLQRKPTPDSKVQHPGKHRAEKKVAIVREGDTASAILERNGFEPTDENIARLHLDNPNLIFPGQKIELPIKLKNRHHSVQVEVKLGDTFGAILKKHGIQPTDENIERIAKRNNLDNPNLIYPGQEIILKGHKTVAHKDHTGAHATAPKHRKEDEAANKPEHATTPHRVPVDPSKPQHHIAKHKKHEKFHPHKKVEHLPVAKVKNEVLPSANENTVERNTKLVLDAMQEFGIDDAGMVAYGFGTINAEVPGFQPIEEYDGGDPSYFDMYEPGTPAGDALGNIYAGDGAKYKGRGFIQLTGRANYTAASEALGIDLVNHPELACDPKVAAKVFAWFLEARKWHVHQALEAGDLELARSYVNGGLNRFAEFVDSYRAATEVIADTQTPDTPETEKTEVGDLAKQVLAHPNIAIADSENDRVRLSIQDLEDDGKTFLYDIANDNNNEIAVSPKLLKVNLNLADKDIEHTITSVTTGTHSEYSHHYDGTGEDVAGNYSDIFRELHENKDEYEIDELIYGGDLPEGMTNLKEGKPFQYDETILAAHRDHIHFSVQR